MSEHWQEKVKTLAFHVLVSDITSALCRRSSPPRPSAAPPRRKGSDPERKRSSALCALTAEEGTNSKSRNLNHFYFKIRELLKYSANP